MEHLRNYASIYGIILVWIIIGCYACQANAQGSVNNFLGVEYRLSDSTEFSIVSADTVLPNFININIKSESLNHTFYYYVFKGDTLEAVRLFDSLYDSYYHDFITLYTPTRFNDTLALAAFYQILDNMDTALVSKALSEFNYWTLPGGPVPVRGTVRDPKIDGFWFFKQYDIKGRRK